MLWNCYECTLWKYRPVSLESCIPLQFSMNFMLLLKALTNWPFRYCATYILPSAGVCEASFLKKAGRLRMVNWNPLYQKLFIATYAGLCYRTYDTRRCLKIAVDGRKTYFNNFKGGSSDTCVDAFARRQSLLSSACPVVFLDMSDLIVLCVGHTNLFNYVRRIYKMLHTDTFSASDVIICLEYICFVRSDCFTFFER